MNRSYISLLFSFIFITSIVAPSILYIADNSNGIVIVNITEEENKGKEKTTDLEEKLLETSHFLSSLFFMKNDEKHHFKLRIYKDYYKNVLSPPPDLV